MERIIDVTAARRQLGTLLDEVFHRGDSVTIERKGKPLAKLVPLDETNRQAVESPPISTSRKQLLEELNRLPAIGMKENPVEILRAMRKEKSMKASTRYGK